MKTLLRSVIRAAIQPPDPSAFTPESTRMNKQRCQANIDAARERLREAHAARGRAARDLRDREERLRRALEVVEDSAAADRASDDAEATARAASQSWAARGCPECDEPDGELLEAATAAHNAAVGARLRADGVRDALPNLTHEEEGARLKLSEAERDVGTAARDVLIALAEPHFVRLERAARECDEAAREVQGLAKSLAGNFGQPVRGGSGQLLARLRESMPSPPRAESRDLIEHGQDLDSDSWLALAKRLLEDPDAK